jgi:multidrug efflux pump subunit AcrA (membrane-fusion protein)
MKHLIFFSLPLVFLFACGKKEEGIKPEKRSITESVYGSGTIKSGGEYKVYSTVSGILQDLPLKEGDSVQLDQLIAVIKGDNSQLNEVNSKLTYDQARDNFNENSPIMLDLKLQIANAESRFKKDSVNFERFRNLKASNAVSDADYDQAELAYQMSQNALISARKKYENNLSNMRTDMRRAENLYKISSNTKRDFEIRSLIKGRIYAYYKQKGELVMPQEPIATVGSADHFIVELLIDELDIAKIKLDQKVLVSIDSYAGKTFECRVTRIYPMPDPRSQTFKVEAEFIDIPETLYPGLSVEGNIVVNEKKTALVIPKSFLIDKTFVQLENGEKKEVKVGLQNTEYVEILEGIDENTVIVKPALEG